MVLGTMFAFGPGANDSNDMLFRVAQMSLNTWCVNMLSLASVDFGDILYRIYRTFSDHCGPLVGLATGYGLDGPGIESR
jgi:hypothetical protein